MKLSERLEAARSCQGEISYDAMDSLLREAAELARRVEGAAHGRVVVPYGDGPDFALANDETMEFANVRHLRNQRVRLVPEAGRGGGIHG